MTENIQPENWKDIIKNKKVIFYNTSVATLLQNGEKHIEKMKWVFQTFQKFTDTVLWWRPHPLELSTVKSMCPQLAITYIELRKSFVENKIGILDDSVDLHRAIAISDAYYGDWSSVATLYHCTNKPMLMAQDNILENVKEPMNVMDFVCFGNDIWFVSFWNNYLFKISGSTRCVEQMVQMPIGVSCSKFFIRHLFIADNELIIVPNNEECILRYDLDKEVFYVEHLTSNILATFSSLFYAGDDIVLGVKGNDNFIYEYNIKTNTCSSRMIGDKENHYFTLCPIGEDSIALLAYNQKKILIWNIKNDKLIEIKGFPQNEKSIIEENPFTDMVAIKQIIYLFPRYSNMVIAINIDKKEIFEVKINYKEFCYDQGMLFTNIKRYGQSILAYSQYTGEWIKFKSKGDEIENLYFEFSEEQKDILENINIFEDYIVNGKNFFEQENKNTRSLDRFLYNLPVIEKQDSMNKVQLAIGKKIYEKLS